MLSDNPISNILAEIKDIWNALDRLKAFDIPSQENLDARGINLDELFATTASDIGGIYKVMTETEAAAGTVVSPAVTSPTTTAAFNFATVANSPHLLRLIAGGYNIHAHLLKTGNRNVTAYCELYKRSSGGTETLLGTAPPTSALTAADTFYDLHIHLAVEVVMLVTDRLVVKWYMVTDGAPAGSSTTMTLTVGGTADSHLSIEIQSQELNNIFVLISEYITGWITESATWTYASPTTLTITGDVTARFPVGTKIKLTQTTVKYFYVVSATYGAPNTTLTITGGSDYSLANAAITLPYYSYTATPQGFPQWFNYAPSFTGFSSNPSGNYRFCIVGRMVTVYHEPFAGTSNATTYTVTAPVTSVNIANLAWRVAVPYIYDNGGLTANVGVAILQAASNIITLYTDPNSAPWANANGKMAKFTLSYEI